MIKKFADKVAVVTGATSGIGAACARKFVEEGAKVALVGRNQEDWQDTFNININGMFYVTRSLKPLLLESHGCIINNASIAGMQHYAAGRSYAYSASKAAVIQFSHQMAKNYGEEHIRVNCICPGIIDTRILGDRDRKIYAERIPMGYVGQPEDVAKVVAFLASEDAAYLTGVVLPIDGGASL